ncbi:MAG: shikimate kinase [Alphaproteobacteria bacterium]|nr:shikimate kinase [Alphaproteobacteria bacterium]
MCRASDGSPNGGGGGKDSAADSSAAHHAILVGLMGCGKSSLGRLLANRLNLAFRDSDADIAARAGKSVARIFAEDGEAAFRAAEREVIPGLLSRAPAAVIALGGGAFTDAATRAECLRRGTVFWLDAPPRILAERVGTADGRPLLSDGADMTATLTRLLGERAEFYGEADHRVDVAAGSEEEVVARMAALWEGDAK